MRRRIKCSYCLVIALLCIAFHCSAQVDKKYFEPVFNKNKLKLNYIPFASVDVLDRRFDTTVFFISESGSYPSVKTNFEKGATATITNYLNQAISSTAHGDKQLLIVLNQCRILNRQNIKRKTGKLPFGIGRASHERIFFEADLYYQAAGGRYQRILKIMNGKYVSAYYSFIHEGFEELLNDLIRAVSIVEKSAEELNGQSNYWFKKDPASFKFMHDSALYTFPEIETTADERWKSSPILKAGKKENGVYENFDDFKNDSIINGTIVSDSMSKDSVFHFSLLAEQEKKRKTNPYAIAYNNDLYINIYKGAYLLLQQKNNRLLFYVPKSLPDMYAILSYEIYLANSSHGSSYLGGAADAVSGIIAFLAITAIDAGVEAPMQKASKNHQVFKKGLKNNFRYCLIDMDNGDFLYEDKDVF